MNRWLGIGLCALLAACGLPAQDRPSVVSQTLPPVAVSESPSVATTRQVTATIYLVREKALVPVQREVDAPVSVSGLMDAITAGPTPQEQARGLRSALLLPLSVESAFVARDGQADVALASNVAETGAAERVLAFGQIVLSLTAPPGIRTVRFSVDGKALPVPRQGGSLTTEPVSGQDYQTLVGK